MAHIKIRTGSIHSRDAEILIVNDDGSEIPIPDLFAVDITMRVNETNKASIVFSGHAEVDIVTECARLFKVPIEAYNQEL
jgi:hypothetical protein